MTAFVVLCSLVCDFESSSHALTRMYKSALAPLCSASVRENPLQRSRTPHRLWVLSTLSCTCYYLFLFFFFLFRIELVELTFINAYDSLLSPDRRAPHTHVNKAIRVARGSCVTFYPPYCTKMPLASCVLALSFLI